MRVVDDTGAALGVMTVDRGMLIARDRGLDLVELVPDATPPVCRITDYGKLCYDLKKKRKASQQRTSQLKEIRLRPKIDQHDLETKLNRAGQFLSKGDRVRLVMRLRGRERGLVPRWKQNMREWIAGLSEARVASPPVAQGRTISVVLEPVGAAS